MRGSRELLTVLCAPTNSQKDGDSSFSATGILKSVSYTCMLVHGVGPRRTMGFTFIRNRAPLDESREWDLKVPL